MTADNSAADASPAIDVRGLVKRFGSKIVVDDVSSRVEAGEI